MEEGTGTTGRRHLYLVLDDWSEGYIIRKIDLESDSTRPASLTRRGTFFTGIHSLPPAFFRFQAPRGCPKSIAGAFGNRILAWPPEDSGGTSSHKLRHSALVFDVHMLTFVPGPEPRQDVSNSIYIPVAGRLFALSGGGSFDMLCPPPAYGDPSWNNFEWSWSELPDPPFQCEPVTSYAVHPDEQTIFVSGVDQSGVPATFSCDVAEPATAMDYMWRRHGPWQLPFSGRAYFDPKLDAWVGLSLCATGHICSCDVISTEPDANGQQCPALNLKISKEKLLSDVPAEKHIGATLVYMGGGSRFCLLEAICIQADQPDQLTGSDEVDEGNVSEVHETDPDEMNEKYLFLRLATFSLKYDKNGDLTTGYSCRVSYYNMPLEVTYAMLEFPVAFWM